MSTLQSSSRIAAVALIAVGLAVVGATVPMHAQTRRVDGGSVALRGFSFFWETRLNPPTPPLASSFGVAQADAATNQVHRLLVDSARHVYFGYTAKVEPLAERNTFRLTFQPLMDLTPELRTRLSLDASAWKPLPAARFPAPQTVRLGDVLELDLLANEAWGQRLTEYVSIQEAPRPPGFQELNKSPRELVFAPGTPRDFTVSDVALRLREPRVFINGRFEESSARSLGDETGSVVWIYLPNRGRFLLSVVPNARLGFRKAGEIRGSSLRFTVGKDTFSLNSAGRIAPGDAAFNLYLLHQPAWKPTYANADTDATIIGGFDRIDDVVEN